MRLALKHSWGLNTVLLCIAAGTAVGAVRMTRATLSLRAEVKSAEERLEKAREKKRDLARRIAEKDAPEAVDYQAKATMNLKNSGEQVVVVLPEQREAPVPAIPSFWERIQSFFRNIIKK